MDIYILFFCQFQVLRFVWPVLTVQQRLVLALAQTRAVRSCENI